MPLQELKQIIANQKTVSTARLAPIVRQLNKIYIQQEQKINAQRKALKRANTRYQRELEKANRRRQAVIDYENLKIHHRNLEREFRVLQEKVRQEV